MIAFNVGIEIGQLLAIAVVVAIGYFILPLVNWPRVRRGAYIALTVTGFIAAVVLSFPGEEEEEPQAKTPAQETAACEQTETRPPTSFAGGHPAKAFYGPAEAAPEVDLEHVVGDGYVIVRYRPDVSEADQRNLAKRVGENDQVIAAAAPDQEAQVTATTAYRVLTCERFDM